MATPILPPKYNVPYYRDLQKGTPNFGKPSCDGMFKDDTHLFVLGFRSIMRSF